MVLVRQLTRFEAVVVPIAVMFFISSLGGGLTEFDVGLNRQWLAPLQDNRSLLFMLTGATLYLSVFGHSQRVLGRPLGAAGLLFFAIACYGGALRVVHDGPGAGASSMIFAGLTILPLTFVCAGLATDGEAARRAIRAAMVSNLVWIAAVAVQYLINKGALTEGKQSRFLGFFGNPQHAAAYLGLVSAVLLWLCLDETRQRLRLLWGAMLVVNAVLLAWTGSRTGLGIFAIGAAVATYRRLGRVVVLLPVFAVLAWLAALVVQWMGIELVAAERLTSTEDTRSESWAIMIEAARQSPWIGVGIGETGKSENSYLYAVSSFGVGMLALVIVLVLVCGNLVLRLLRLRPSMDERHRSLADLVVAFMGMYFAGAVLEGYLMARVSSTLVLFILFAAIGRHLVLLAEAGEADAAAWDDEPWDEYADDLDEDGYPRGLAAAD